MEGWRVCDQNGRMDEFARRLRERAAELGISNAEVARRCGLGERQYGYYIAGTRQPNLQALVKIADVLDLTVDNLLGRSDRPPLTIRQRLIDRLLAASRTLQDAELVPVVVQIEALAANKPRTGDYDPEQPA